MKVRKILAKGFGAIFLLFIVALIYGMLRSDGVISEPKNEVILMPDSEFANNPVLFRAEDGTLTVPVVDRGNCQQIIAAIRRPDRLYWEVNTTMRTPNGSERTSGRYYQSGSLSRTELYGGGGSLLKTAISNGRSVFVRTPSGSRTVTNLELYKPETILQMSDIDFFLNCDSRNLLVGEIREYKGYDCLYVSYRFPELNQVENYYISLKYGLPLYAETVSGGSVTFTAETVALEDQFPREVSFSMG